MGFGLGRPAGPSYPSAGARGCSENRQRQLALIDSPGLGQVAGEGREVYEGVCIYSPERGQKSNPSFQLGSNWKDSSGRADVGGFPQGPPSRFHFLFWVFRNCRAPPRPHAPFGCEKGGAQVL